jgi:uncharacterized protein
VLEVTFYRDECGRPAGLSAAGHADFADYGDDIVCAAVSAVLQAARLGLSEFASGPLSVRQQPGALEIAWSEPERDCASIVAIFSTAELSVAQLARQYPAHVRIFRAKAAATGAEDPERVTESADQRRVDDV